MKMICETHVAAPREAVFAAFADVPSWAEHTSGIQKIEMLTDGPVGIGTRFRETRIMFKKEATEEMEFTAFDSPSLFTLEAESCGCRYVSDHRFIEKDGGTLIQFEMTSHANSFLAKLMTPLGYIFSGTMKKMILKDMNEKKAHLEQDATAPVA